MPKKAPPLIAACAFELDSSSPGRVQIFPAGVFDAKLGAMRGAGPWRLTAAAASALIRRVASRKTPLHFDYHHASLAAAEHGRKAPAAGWLDTANLVWEDGAGLFGVGVEWTAAAAAEIAAKQYRFLSPVFSYDEKTGVPLDLYSIALTNAPAIDGMADLLAAAQQMILENPMDDLFERLCYLLNLPLTTTPAEMNAQLDKLKGLLAAETAEDATAAASGLPGLLAAKNAKIAALTHKQPDPAQFVPIAALQQSNERLAALEARERGREVEALIQPALADGRLLPDPEGGAGQEAWARGLGKSNLAALQQFLATARPIAALRGMQTKGKTPPEVEATPGALNETELAVCAQMGLGTEQYFADKAKKKPGARS